MACNRPSADAPTTQRKRGFPPVAKGLLGGAIVVAVLGAALFFLFPGDDTPAPSTRHKAQGTIKEATPAAAPTNVVVEAPKKKELKTWEYPVSRTNELNPVELRKWIALHRPPAGITNNTSSTEPPPYYAIFTHRSENEIAALLTLRPGEGIVGTPIYGKWLEDDFLKSCEEPIVVTDEDTPEQAELKRAMIETKIDIRNRMAAGEKLGDILLATRREYQDLATYKHELQNQLYQLRKDSSLSMQDIDDFVTAANQMLEKKGIAPISLSPIMRRRLLHERGLTTTPESLKKGTQK